MTTEKTQRERDITEFVQSPGYEKRLKIAHYSPLQIEQMIEATTQGSPVDQSQLPELPPGSRIIASRLHPDGDWMSVKVWHPSFDIVPEGRIIPSINPTPGQ